MTVPLPAGFPVLVSFFAAATLRRSLPPMMCLLLLGGCTSEEPIVVEQVPKEDIAPAPVPRQVRRTDRMLAAIIPHGETAIFFKTTGPAETVAGVKDGFLRVVQSVTFENDEPRWTLPDGWTEEAASGERLATIQIPGDPPLTATVTSLPMRGDDTEYRLANVNRWRGQMGLAPMVADQLHQGGDLDEETVEVPLSDGTKATLVNIAGEFESGGMMPPFLSGGGTAPPMTGASTPAATAGNGPEGLTYTVPEGWQDRGNEGISAATLVVGDVKTTVTPLAATANPLLPNVNRWRDQVGLPALTESQLDESLETVTLGDGREAKFVELVAPGSQPSQQAILGVIAYRGETAWFVKMVGNAEDVLKERDAFQTFVTSLRFSEGDE